MGNTAVSGSLLVRFVRRLRLFYKTSLVCAFFAALSRGWEHSRTRRMIAALLGGPCRTLYGSKLYRIYRRAGTRVSNLGAAVGRVWRSSLLRRATAGVWHSGCLRGSLLLRPLRFLKTEGVLLTLFTLYLPIDWALRQINSLAFLASYWDEAFLVFGLLFLIYNRARKPACALPGLSPLHPFLFFFLGVSIFLMFVVSPNFGVAVSGWRAQCQYILWFFVVGTLAAERRRGFLLCGVMVGLGTLIGLHGLYQFAVGVQIPAAWVSVYEQGVRTRVFSIIGSPNIMGSFLVLLAPLAAAFSYIVKPLWAKVCCWGATLVMCLSCIFTFSRGGWLGMAVAIVVFGLFRDRRILAVSFLVAGAAVFVPQIANRVAFLLTPDFAANNESGGRAARWVYGLELLHRNDPVLGFGLGRFGGAVAMQSPKLLGVTYFYMDNYYMKTLVEMGYVGLVSYVGLLLGLVGNGLRALFVSRKRSADYSLACGLLAGLCGVLVHCFWENIFEVPYMNAYFWGLAAVLMAVGFRWEKEDKE